MTTGKTTATPNITFFANWVTKGVVVTPSVPVKANRGVRARVPAAGKVLEGGDQRTLSELYYDVGLIC